MKRSAFDALMQDACVRYGFCGCRKQGKYVHVTQFIPPEGPVAADQFVEWLFLADDMNPNADLERWQRQKDALRAAFITHMGAETVDARLLRWSDDDPLDDEWDQKKA